MNAEEQKLLEIAARVSDGSPVDWESEELSASSDQLRKEIRHLRLVSDLASVHGTSAPGEMTEVDPLQMSATVNMGKPCATGGDLGPPLEKWGGLEIREKIGEGGFGEVYRAWDSNLDREVALKLIRPRWLADATHAGTVLEEGRMLARVRHPNVISVHGAETHDERVGLWMEFVRGRTLTSLMGEQGKFGAREAAMIGIELCRALAAVHRAGLVHRDIKTDNVMRDEEGRYVLMDFGAGQNLDDLEARTSGAVLGTPLYIAPEIFLGQPATPQSDIYSMGVLLYNLVSGAYPVTGTTLSELRESHQRQNASLLRDERSDLPEAFIQVVERALAWDPARRFGTAGQLEQALSGSLGLEVAPAPEPTLEPLPPVPLIRRLIVGLPIALGAIVLGAAGWILVQSSRQQPAVSENRPAASTAVSASAYDVKAQLFRQRDGKNDRLETGAQVQVGDELSLEVQSSRDLYVYIFNEDAKGNAFALFPLPGFELQNPLPANTRHILPGQRDGTQVRWQVDSAGDREHLIVLASPEPLAGFEQEMSRLALPGSNAIAVPVPEAAKERLRGIGGLVESTGAPATENGDMLFEMARRLAGRPEQVEGVWMHEIELSNPDR